MDLFSFHAFFLKLLVFQYSTLISFRFFIPRKVTFSSLFFDPFPAAGGSQTLKGCSKSKLAIAFLKAFGISDEPRRGWFGGTKTNPKNPRNPTNFECDFHNMCFTIVHDFRPFSQRPKKKRNQKQTYRIKVAACGVQSNTPQTGNSLVSHPFSWRRNQPTTEKPLEKPLTIHPLLSHSIPPLHPFCPRPVISVGIVQGFLRLNFVFQVKVLGFRCQTWGEKGHKFSSQLKAVNCDFRSFSFSIEIPASFRGWNL